jgi:H+/gluconate symporter and related permeases
MSALGALIGLILSIILIIKKISPVYSLTLGALAGGLLGGAALTETIANMIGGVKDITPAVIRILTAGVLSGVLIKTRAADSISHVIVKRLGEKNVFLALALSTMLLTGIGVFIDVAVITVAPIALIIGQRLSINKLKLLLAMIGGGKCGNIISPNPNTIIAAENMGAPLPSVMFVNIVPAIVGLLITVFIIVRLLPKENKATIGNQLNTLEEERNLPSFAASIVAPLVAVILLALRPLFGIEIDPLIALPAGGIVGILAMRKTKDLVKSLQYGLEKMSVVAVLLIGTGTIAGVIKASTMKDVILSFLEKNGIGDVFIAPISGALMSAATASTTAGATVASASFSEIIVAAGISAVWGAAMINSGATILDHLPHGSFFHATGGSVEMDFKDRMKLIPYETAVGFVLALGTVVAYYVVR